MMYAWARFFHCVSHARVIQSKSYGSDLAELHPELTSCAVHRNMNKRSVFSITIKNKH